MTAPTPLLPLGGSVVTLGSMLVVWLATWWITMAMLFGRRPVAPQPKRETPALLRRLLTRLHLPFH